MKLTSNIQQNSISNNNITKVTLSHGLPIYWFVLLPTCVTHSCQCELCAKQTPGAEQTGLFVHRPFAYSLISTD